MQCSDGSANLSGKPLNTYEVVHALGFSCSGLACDTLIYIFLVTKIICSLSPLNSQIQGTDIFAHALQSFTKLKRDPMPIG